MRNVITTIGLLTVPNKAWDKEGHDAVGGTAMSMLDSSASSKLKGILGGEDASDVAGWAHKIESAYGWTQPVHFMAQISDWECKTPDSASSDVCKDGRCLETSIRHFYRELIRGESIPGKNVMKDDSGFTDADALRFLINLVGDLGQPLHVGFKSNNFGKDLYVKLPGGLPIGSGEVVSLFELLDSRISYNIINNPRNPNFWWSGWTHVHNMHPLTLENERKRWQEKGIDAVADWIQDSAEFSCKKVYSDPNSGEKFTFSNDRNAPTELSMMTYRLWEKAVSDRILLAGARLGILLNAILSNPDAPSAAKLRRGSAVIAEKANDAAELVGNVFDDLDDRTDIGGKTSRSSPRKPVTGYNAGLVNIGILAGVVFLVICVVWFPGKRTHDLKVAKSHLVEMVGPHAKHVMNSHRD